MSRIVVNGYMVRHPLAGNVLAYFQYVLGFRRLGHEVVYLEVSGWPYSSYDPTTRLWVEFPETGLRLVRDLASRYCPDVPVVWVDSETGEVDGMSWEEVKDTLAQADLLVNVGGVCWLPEFMLAAHRAFVDMDPFFTQIGQFGSDLLDGYNLHLTYGTNVGSRGCTVPDRGLEWTPTLPPVVPEIWAGDRPGADAPLTTITAFSPAEPVIHEGERYGMKDEELLRLLDLPSRTSQTLELALACVSEDVVDAFTAAGWKVRDAGPVSRDVDVYRAFIQSSRGELSAAKNAYVKTWSGWFSDRSACYLAAGRPVVLQDTGYGETLPVGRGLLAFATLEEAAQRIEELNADYEAHAAAALRIARDHLAYDVVLPRLLELSLRARSGGKTR